MRLAVLSILAALSAVPALAQADPDAARRVVPGLPDPGLDDNAPPSAYLRAAQGAIAAGRLAEARQALEMAQTRMLDRSVPLFQTRNPSDNPAVGLVSSALRALEAGDRAQALESIRAASRTADGPER
jgi:hypothetical protein